jgi:glutathione peroxidase
MQKTSRRRFADVTCSRPQQNITMTFRQKVIKWIYPMLTRISRKKGINMKINANEGKAKPAVSFYSLRAIANHGGVIDFNEFRNRKVLLVNTASACGYTPQFDDLQRLHAQYKNKVAIIGFPSNDFGEQEKGSDAEIASFCKVNFGVTFPLAKKSHVIKTAEQNQVFKWLTDKNQNGWNEQSPQWNFCKYLVDENGILLNYFASGIQPFDKDIIDVL